jgi:hypothetical protein
MAMDMRQRVDPPLPELAAGNLMWQTSPDAVNVAGWTLGEVAAHVRGAVEP